MTRNLRNDRLPTPSDLAQRQRILIYLESVWSKHPNWSWGMLVADLWFLDEDTVEGRLKDTLH
jgi:hypothetical protein